MKKFLLLALILSSCQTTTVEESPCAAPDGTYVASYTEEWEGIEFQLPWCWTSSERMDGENAALVLTHGDGEAYVELSFNPPEENLSDETYTEIDYADTKLYFHSNKMDHPNVQTILYSLEN